MSQKLPVICIFGADLELASAAQTPPSETTALECHCFPGDVDLETILIRLRPHVIVSVGQVENFPKLLAAPFDVRRRWIHFPDAADPAMIGAQAFYCYLSVCLDPRPEQPLVSIFTPTYRTGERFARAFASVAAQTYTNWEWVLWDDSDDGGQTHAMLQCFAARDHRLRVIRPERHSGVIGEVKYNTCMSARGDLLVELDHDDELMPEALAEIVTAAGLHPKSGFFYSDFAEVSGQFEPLRYPDGWAFGFGSYREEVVRGVALAVAQAPPINATTVRSLVGLPNHVRVWRRSLYLELGGHNRLLPVADDYDLLVRTFLATSMVRIPKLCYIQYHEGANTQRLRNQDIQRHVRYLAWRYDDRIRARLLELNLCNPAAPPNAPVYTVPADMVVALRNDRS